MDIFLLRHFESIKNTQVTFSSIDDKEGLTKKGIKDGKKTAKKLRTILTSSGKKIMNIYCARSVRAIKSAEIIAKELGIKVESFSELLSTKSTEILGKTKEEVKQKNPRFIMELEMYDSGLYNSYNFHRDINKSQKIEYENNVNKCIQEIINRDSDEIKIIVLHNSSITATLINFARKYYQYPNDFYGKVITDSGNIFWIRKHENGNAEFKAMNYNIKQFMEIYNG
jgi:broad specificity phosphatase PhoE